MTDLVKRLRKGACSKLEAEAADEIERLEQYYQAEYEIVERIWKVLGIENFGDTKGKEISEIVQEKLDEIEELRMLNRGSKAYAEKLHKEIERLREALRLAKDDALRVVDGIDRELDVRGNE